jgi:hypothetical protein
VGVLSPGKVFGFLKSLSVGLTKMSNERERWEMVLGIRVCLFAWGRVRAREGGLHVLLSHADIYIYAKTLKILCSCPSNLSIFCSPP